MSLRCPVKRCRFLVGEVISFTSDRRYTLPICSWHFGRWQTSNQRALGERMESFSVGYALFWGWLKSQAVDSPFGWVEPEAT